VKSSSRGFGNPSISQAPRLTRAPPSQAHRLTRAPCCRQVSKNPPLGLQRDKATRYMEGQSHSVYQGTNYFLLPCSGASGKCPRDRPSASEETVRCMKGQSHSVHGGTKPLGLPRDRATRFTKGQSHSVYEGAKYFLLPCSDVSGMCSRDRPSAWGETTWCMEGQSHSDHGGTKPLGLQRGKATRPRPGRFLIKCIAASWFQVNSAGIAIACNTTFCSPAR